MAKIFRKISVAFLIMSSGPGLAVEEEEDSYERRSLRASVERGESPTQPRHPVMLAPRLYEEDWTDKCIRWCVLSGFLSMCGCIEVTNRHAHDKHTTHAALE